VIEVPSVFTGSEWQINRPSLSSLVLQRTLDVLFVVNPSNPTGSIVAEGSAAFPALFGQTVPCILDITYDAMVYGPSQPFVPADCGHHFIVGSLSKTFAIPGIRVGFLVAPHWARETCAQIVEATTMGVSSLSQEYAVNSLEDWLQTGGAWFKPVMTELQARRDLTVHALGRAGFSYAIPRAGYYVFAQLPGAWAGQAVDFCRALQRTAGVEVVPGTDFGADYGSFVRISFANPRTRAKLADSLGRIGQFMKEVVPEGATPEAIAV
jgi:aspartate aminotransferase